MTSRLGVMKAEMIGADFENDTLTFKVSGDYYARTGWFYIVPNIVYEELVELSSAKARGDDPVLRDADPVAELIKERDQWT